MPLWTTADDVRSRWIGDDPLDASDAQIETFLGDVEDTVLSEFADLPSRIDADPTVEPRGIPLRRVRKVISRVVIRHLRNPAGVRTTQEGAGPFQSGATHGGTEPGSLALTDQDRAELADGVRGGAFTVDTSPRIDRAPLDPSVDPWLWDEIP